MSEAENPHVVIEIDIEGDVSEFFAALGIGDGDSESYEYQQGVEDAQLSQAVVHLCKFIRALVIGAFLLGWVFS